MKQLNKRSLLFVFSLLVLSFAVNSMVFAQSRAPLVVGDGSLASCTEAAFDAVLATAAGNSEADTITFSCGGPATIVFTATKVLGTDMTIDGGGNVTFDGGFTGVAGTGERLFQITPNTTVSFNGLTFTKGDATAGLGGNGAAIHTAGNVNISNSTFKGNRGGRGSAIAADKDGAFPTPIVNIFRSAFVDNTATDRGVFYVEAAELNVANSTFSNNVANSNPGSILRTTAALGTVVNFTNVTFVAPASPLFSSNFPVNLRNSIISTTSAALCDGTGGIADGTGNVVFGGGTCTGLTPASTANPNLSALSADFVPFYDLGAGSSAFNLVSTDAYLTTAANPLFNGAVTVDQRGVARPAGAGKDAGAIEGAGDAATPETPTPETPTPETPTPETPTPETPTPETPTPETPTPETPVPEEPVPGAFNLLSPANGAVVNDPATVTEVTWSLSTDADSYEFVLLKTSDNVRLGEVARVTVLAAECGATAGVCTLPVDAAFQSLLTDGAYSWSVEAENTGGITEAANAPFTFTVSTDAVELVINGGFENGKDAIDPWSLKNESKDKVKCNKPEKSKIFAFTGECAWLFKGVPGDSAKLVQSIDPAKVNATDVLTLSVAVKSKVTPGKLVTLKVKYADPAAGTNGDGKDKVVIEIDGPTLNEEYEVFSASVTAAAAPNKVKLILKGKAESGKIFVDDVSLTAQPIVGGGDALIPLPLALPLP